MKENYRKSESGNAGVKLVITLVIFGLMANAGINYIVAAYNSENLRQEMQTSITQAMSLPPKSAAPADYVKKRLEMYLKTNEVPADAFIDVKQINGMPQARIAYTKQIPVIPFGIYNYPYKFDHTASPGGFLTKQ